MSSPSTTTAQKRKRDGSVTPPPRSPPRERKRPSKATTITKPHPTSSEGSRPIERKRDASVTPPPRSPPRERKRPSKAAFVNKDKPQQQDGKASPPRQRKRPTNAAPISSRQIEEARRRQVEREQLNREADAPRRDVSDFVKQHYNAVPERGREWRKTDSKIKGLRSYNNWAKSCLIQKCGPKEFGAKVLDIGCGKGGDLMKWQSQKINLYVGIDPADVSIQQARDRYRQMQRKNRRLFDAEFIVRDGFGKSLDEVGIVMNVGFDAGLDMRWGGGGFDTVSMMFCMHYAFESEEKARTMLKNVAGALKKGGRFLGVIPNSDALSERVVEYHQKHSKPAADVQDDDDDDWDPEKSLDTKEEQPEPEAEPEEISWGNSIYQVKFPGKTPKDGIFRPPFGWKYFYFLEEAVDQVPEFVVPWEAFRGLAEDYNLELEYRKPFPEIWDEEKDDPNLGVLSERMGVRDRYDGKLLVTAEEMEAASFYHAFSFYKV